MTYLRNCWYVAGYIEDASETPLARKILDEPVVIFRTENGAAVALDNRCPHRFAPLSRGQVIGETIQCPYHGLRFGPDGMCAHVPSGLPSPPHALTRVYPLVERYTVLWIWMGDPARADADLIPDFSYLEDTENYGWFNGYIHSKANYQLIIDNLLDLSHAEFLHPMLRSDGWAARNQQTIEQSDTTVTINNLAEDDNVLPIMKMVMPDLGQIGKTIQTEVWVVPSLIKLSVEYYCAEGEILIPSAHFVTPETMSTSHYFTRSSHSWEPHNPAITAAYGAGIQHVFESEDMPIVEAQQEFLGNKDIMDVRPAILKSDSGNIRVRRLLAKRIREEALGEAAVAASAE